MLTMKYVLLFLISTSAFARLEKSPYEKYSSTNNFTTSTKVTWEAVDNINKVCNEIHIKLTGKPYPYPVNACTTYKKKVLFFQQYECHIITSKTTNNDILGHEIRHCFQGEFHK